MLPKMRTIKEAVAEFRSADPATAITETYLRRLVVTGQVPHVKAGNKYLINMDVLSHFLEGQENKKAPHHSRRALSARLLCEAPA